MTACKYPEVTVKLVGGNGNAFVVLGSVIQAMRAAKLTDDEIKQFQDEAMSGDSALVPRAAVVRWNGPRRRYCAGGKVVGSRPCTLFRPPRQPCMVCG